MQYWSVQRNEPPFKTNARVASALGLTGAGVFWDGQMHNPPRLVWAFVRSAADVRDLRDLTGSLSQFSDRLNNDGALGVLGAEKLPDYKPGKTK